ncbi:MAG: hypothetical protein EBS42_03010 [Caulobacteraceae bacterium]|nr:hypothetical protein [Caulobacteraceae bacterium]
MSRARIFAMVALLSLVGSVGVAHAQTAPKAKPSDAFRVRGEFDIGDRLGPDRSERSLQFDAKAGKWGVKVGLGAPLGREADAKDLEAGAYFRVTPSLRVGGALGVASERDNPVRRPGQKDEAPRVRLETTFKF